MAEKKTSVETIVKNILKKGQEEIFGRGEDPDRHRKIEGENTVTELCRREGIEQYLYYVLSKEFLEADKHHRLERVQEY